MAATADSWRQDQVVLGAGRLYVSVGVPANDARLAITSLTPDSASGAVHIGATKAGAVLTVTESYTDFFADEFPDPFMTNLEQTGMMLEGELLAAGDMSLLAGLSGAMTYATSTGYKQASVGRKAVSYQGVCLIAPRADDSTKIIVAHIYKAINKAGVKVNFGRKEMASVPFQFQGYAITTRDADDTIGNYWTTTS